MNKLFIAILLIVLSLPIYVLADDTVIEKEPVAQVNTLDDEIDLTKESSSYKEPISKRKIVKKFLAAMGGVAISSFAIFFILSAYNRIREGFENSVKTLDNEVTLETPEDLKGAMKVFLDKTKW